MSGIDIIAAERRRQVEAEGWTPEHDDEHAQQEMAIAAACYAVYGTDKKVVDYVDTDVDGWPWDDFDKRNQHPRLRRLAIAGALIAAEIDRVLRLPPCPRCSECEGEDHHWMPNGNYQGDIGPAWSCKHCEHVQDVCPACGGDCVGECLNDDEGDPGPFEEPSLL